MMSFGYAPHTLFVAWLVGLLVGGHRVFRIPILFLLTAILAVEVLCYFALRWLVVGVEILLTTRLYKRQSIERKLDAADSFAAWAECAAELDKHEGREAWKAELTSRDYHPAVLRAAVGKLRKARAEGDAPALMEHLRFSLSWNFGGYMNSSLYCQSHVGTKVLVGEFAQEVEEGLAWLASSVRGGGLADRLSLCADFVHDAGSAFGSTCLFMSGGGHLGFYHFGILRAMLAEGHLPNLICGTSMGSICAAYIATRTDEEALAELTAPSDELYRNIGPEGGPMQGTRLERLWTLLRRGYVYDHSHMLEHLQWFTKGLTFLEAHNLTGRVVSITCTPQRTSSGKAPTLLLNHLNAPNVLIGTAVMASSCVPGLIPPVRLEEKVDGKVQTWRGMAWDTTEGTEDDNLQEVLMRDGSFENDVPIKAMSSVFNTHFSIVSQVNPHIIPFFYHPTGVAGRPIRWPWRKYRGGFLVHLMEVWLKEDMIKNLMILQKTRLLFNVLGVDWSYLFTQQDHGEVTIVPAALPSDYVKVMDNIASREDLTRKLRHSERNAWQNFTQIAQRTRLQRALHTLGEEVIQASEQATPGVREAVIRRCGPVHAEAFRVRGCPGSAQAVHSRRSNSK